MTGSARPLQMLPHPLTGKLFPSPVPPGTGWPEDPATAGTPVADSPGEVRVSAMATGTVEELRARSSVCRACPRLVGWREDVAGTKRAMYADQPYWGRPVPSFGNPDPRLVVLGLAPAAQGGNRTGRMFTGDRSGDWIFAALHRAGYASRETVVAAGDGQELRGVRMVAPVRCAPPANKPTAAEITACSGWLDRELQLMPRVGAILALGGIAWATALQAGVRMGWEVPRPRPKFGHTAQTALRVDSTRSVRLIGCYHVSQQNTFTGRLTEVMLDQAIALAGRAAGL